MTRTFLEAVRRPFVLSQRPLLTEKQLMDAASIRGLKLFRSEQLEGLHRRKILVPLLRVNRPVLRLRAHARRPEAWRRWGILTGAPLHAQDLLEEAGVGRVALLRGTMPVLRRRIQTAQASGKVDRIPVCRIVVEAYEGAARPRRHVMMRVG